MTTSIIQSEHDLRLQNLWHALGEAFLAGRWDVYDRIAREHDKELARCGECGCSNHAIA